MSSPSIPQTMRAWTYTARGQPRRVLSLTSIPTPPPPTGANLLVRVSHAAINPDGTIVMRTSLTTYRRKPCIPELEFSGVIVAAGPSVPSTAPGSASVSLTPGTAVVGWFQPYNALIFGQGALAEYVTVASDSVVVKPKGVGFEEAAGMTAVGQTAWKMLRVAQAREGMKVLVNGGSTGVGTMLVQLLKLKGCEVVATCSEGNAGMVRRLGADEIVDYRKEHPVWEYLAKEYKGRPFDIIFDTAGTQALFSHSPAYLKEDGPFVNVGAFEGPVKTLVNAMYNWFWPIMFGGVPRKYFFHTTAVNKQVEEELMDLLEKRKIKVEIEKVYPMEDALEGYDKIVGQRAKGKQIVKVQSL